MFAIIRNNNIAFVSVEPVAGEECVEYSDAITHPIYQDGVIVQFLSEEEKNRIKMQEYIQKILSGNSLSPGEQVNDEIIGEIIRRKHYNDNYNAQIADLAKFSIKAVAVFSTLIGKEQTKQIFSAEIEKARHISDTRVLCGLEPFDLSFLD